MSVTCDVQIPRREKLFPPLNHKFHEQPISGRFPNEPPRRQDPFRVEIGGLLDSIQEALSTDPARATEAAARLAKLLASNALESPAPTQVRGGLAPWQVRKIDRYLQENPERSIRLCELADLVSLSVSYFCRAFKDSFGSTPHGYFIRRRLELAQRLMLNTDEPLSQIAIASGHVDQAHLCKLFRRRMGETPNAWRRRNLTS